MACLPLVPSATTTISETVLMRATKPWRTTAWSSITMILILSSLIHRSSSATDRHIHQDFRTLAFTTIYFQRAANPHRTFLHADQAKVFCITILRLLIIETMSVVSHTY